MLLTLLILIPIVGAIIIFAMPSSAAGAIKWLALIISLVVFGVSLPLYFGFEAALNPQTGYHFEEIRNWIPSLGEGFDPIRYHIGIDGLSLWLVLLTTFLTFISVLSSWTAIEDSIKEYMALMLLLEAAVIGVFVSLDLFLYYLFWEASLIPMALLVGRWGGKRRIYAALKFFLYTMAGSALMLVGAIYLYGVSGTSDLPTLTATLDLPVQAQLLLFFAFALAFSVKVPLFPLHTWLPAAHVEAPTAGSIMLAGVLLKLGTYSYLRFAIPLFPDAVPFWGPILATLGVVGIIYGALVALVQEDVKSLVAYSSVAHMGFIVLGIFMGGQQGMSGAVLQMINHGLSTGMLFFMVGVLYEQRHTRLFTEYGGIWVKVPVFGTFFLLAVFASVGLPGLNGFVGEFIILMGTFRINWLAAAFGTFGIVLAAWYLLTATRKLMFGPFNEKNANLKDMNGRELGIAVAFIALCFLIGLFPDIFFAKINPATEQLAQILNTSATLLAGQ
ncbi:MAG TPA: NADH-quinone oxidoreductase subunit M [Anaerolineae bacterium]|nr:NADH-quinone oxidoreductase subunit M [Anaerolineae bacterium]